jgi:hypothetical protein
MICKKAARDEDFFPQCGIRVSVALRRESSRWPLVEEKGEWPAASWAQLF